MSIRNWSTTAASNNSAPPNGAPEGMAPSGVNNTMRQMMADVRDTVESLPFFDYGHTATRVDADTFTIASDVTSIYTAGRSLKLVGATTEYGSVSSSSYSAPDTTINIVGTVPTSLSTVSVGIVGAQVRYEQTAAELAAGVTPVNYAIPNHEKCGYALPERYGAAGNGVTDDSAAMVKIGKMLGQGISASFNPDATYLISYSGASESSANDDDYGRKVIYLSGVDDVCIRGNGATIKCVNHDIAANGGLMFFWGTDCSRIKIKRLRFDMTFTGTKNSSSFYPFCGGIIFVDTATGAHTQATLCGDLEFEDLTFKLYHPYGQYVTTSNAYAGDPNNGYKLFSVFCSGDHAATAYSTQNRKVLYKNIRFEDGHNGYGIWTWAYNNVVHDKITGESWVGKRSNTSGVIQGAGVAMIRYIQWYCSGYKTVNCSFRAKPCDERTTSGFEGAAIFAAIDTNLTGDHNHGNSIVSANDVVLGNGDAANSLVDYGVIASCYGDIKVCGNNFDGITTTTNAYAGQYVLHNPEAGGGDGDSTLSIIDNTCGIHGSYNNNFGINNGSSASADARRCKSLIVKGNTSLAQAQYLVDMVGGSSATYLGCAHTQIEGNTVIGTYNTLINSADSNSRAFNLGANQSTDTLRIMNNTVKDKYYFGVATNVHASAIVDISNNIWEGGTTEWLGGSMPNRDGYGPNIASSATITLPYAGKVFLITGTTNITGITAARAGREVTLIFDNALTLTDGSNLTLAGNFTSTSSDTIKLVSDGANWIEVSRSVN